MAPRKQFGGEWTSDKLERVRKYLVAYATIMKKQNYRFAYIDAFAGTGYRVFQQENNYRDLMFPEFVEKETKEFMDGSTRIALQVQPRFDKYIFIEKELKRFEELSKLKADFSAMQNDIILINADANSYISDLCQNYKWEKHRAVLFLDPYGMQVTWKTVEMIAGTKAIDLWYLFPLGVAVNRLLKKDGQINEPLRKKLDEIFGTTEWFNVFYEERMRPSLFGTRSSLKKAVNFEAIGQYFVSRMKGIFSAVADNPLPLYNIKNNPLFLLCFASGNPKGANTAIKIAQDILAR